MIRIKAPKIMLYEQVAPGVTRIDSPRPGGRLYTEAMHRRVVALVKACEGAEAFKGREPIWNALAALRAQAEKEAGK